MRVLVAFNDVGQDVQVLLLTFVELLLKQPVNHRRGRGQMVVVTEVGEREPLHQGEIRVRQGLGEVLMAMVIFLWGGRVVDASSLRTPSSPWPASLVEAGGSRSRRSALRVVFHVVPRRQDINDARGVVHTSDQPEPVVAHIEDDAVADLVGRSECLPERSPVGPVGVLREPQPGREVPPGNRRVGLAGFPEQLQPLLGNDADVTPDRREDPPEINDNRKSR